MMAHGPPSLEPSRGPRSDEGKNLPDEPMQRWKDANKGTNPCQAGRSLENRRRGQVRVAVFESPAEAFVEGGGALGDGPMVPRSALA